MKELQDNSEIEGFEPPKFSDQQQAQESFDEAEVVSPEDEVTELDVEERKEFQSLLTIGRITKTIDVLGHPVVLKTMTVADELLVGLETQKYRGTEAFARAYQSAIVAATIVSIDKKQLYIPISQEESSSEVFAKKIEKIHSLYPIVVSEIYKNYMDVEKEFSQLAKKLGKL